MGLQICLETGNTQGEEVYVSVQRDTSWLSPCNHEEADTRMILHVADAIHEGYMQILLRTVDPDVVTAMTAAAKLSTISDLEQWVAFGTGKRFKYIPVHEINLRLPLILTGQKCYHHFMHTRRHSIWDTVSWDTVSAFAGRGKHVLGCVDWVW